MKLLIGTPTYNGSVTGVYTRSLLGLFHELKFEADWETTQAVLLVAARNFLASLTLERGYTHLLFLDADVQFAPSVIRRMLDFDRPLVAAAYPHRTLDVAKFHAAARHYDRPQVAFAAALTFPVDLEEPRVSEGEFHRAVSAPTGMMLIKREVFEKLREAHPDLYVATGERAASHSGLRHILQCFEPLPDDNGLKMSEDISFCQRWTDLGGEIWVTFDESIGHTGPYTFRAAPNAP
jgi:hypothetical protein